MQSRLITRKKLANLSIILLILALLLAGTESRFDCLKTLMCQVAVSVQTWNGISVIL